MKSTLLFYINAIHEGGAERVILQLAHHFAQVGYRSVVVTSFVDKNEYPVPEDVIRLSIENQEIKQSKLKRNISRIKALRKICRQEKPAAVISFMAEPNIRSVIATKGLPVKSIVSVRNDPNREYSGRLGRLCGKYLLPMADGCVFQTEDAKAWFSQKLQKKSQVIMNDVDPVFFNTPYVGSKDIVTLGRLCEQKNQKLLISAYAAIAEKYPDWRLCICGIGPLENELKNMISEKNMQDHIFLMGQTTCAQDVLAHAGVFVLSSDYEGMPNALMEALAIGVPSISTDCPCGGPKMLIENGKNGLLIPVRDETAMSKAIANLIEDPDLSEKFKQNMPLMAENFRTEKVFQQWYSYIEKTVGAIKQD